MNSNHFKLESPETKVASPAGIIRRLVAYAVDIAILGTAVVTFQFGLQVITGGFPANRLTTGWQLEGWVFATVSLPTWAYFVFMVRSTWQASLGKRLLGLWVADTRGHRMGFGRALLRTVVKLIPWELTHLSLMLPTPIWSEGASTSLRPGLIIANVLIVLYVATAALTPRKQGPHDFVAGTLVLRRRNEL